MNAPRLVGTVHLDHPGHIDRERGVKPRAYLTVDRRLKGGKLDEVELDESKLLELAESAVSAVRILREKT